MHTATEALSATFARLGALADLAGTDPLAAIETFHTLPHGERSTVCKYRLQRNGQNYEEPVYQKLVATHEALKAA